MQKKLHILKLPHLNYTIVVEKKKKGDRDESDAYTKRVSVEESLICLPLPITGPVRQAHLVHEIMHVLQNICEGDNMNFLEEREHMAYIAGWLFTQISKI